MDYQEILDKLVSGEIKEYEVEPTKAYDFQKALRNYGKRQNISGKAVRGGKIIYSGAKGAN